MTSDASAQPTQPPPAAPSAEEGVPCTAARGEEEAADDVNSKARR